MKKINNATHIEGYLYEHKLENKVTGANSKHPGTPFITGSVSIATDNDVMNIVTVYYRYVTATTAKNKPNATYATLQNIIDGKASNIVEHGIENAALVRADSALALNEWYDLNDPNEPLISRKRNEGGFIHVIQKKELSDENSRATFDVDMLINSVVRLEAEENQPEKVRVKGCIFDFRGAILPVDFTVLSPGGMNYFESLEASPKNPVFTRVKGIQISKNVVKEVVEESAFGDAMVTYSPDSQRDFVIVWARPDTYEFDTESTILASELAEKMSEREIYLAETKKNQKDYQANKGNALAVQETAAPVTTAAKKEYNF